MPRLFIVNKYEENIRPNDEKRNNAANGRGGVQNVDGGRARICENEVQRKKTDGVNIAGVKCVVVAVEYSSAYDIGKSISVYAV